MTIKIRAEFDPELEIPNFRTFHDAYHHVKAKHFGNSLPPIDDVVIDEYCRIVGGVYTGVTDLGADVTFKIEEL